MFFYLRKINLINLKFRFFFIIYYIFLTITMYLFLPWHFYYALHYIQQLYYYKIKMFYLFIRNFSYLDMFIKKSYPMCADKWISTVLFKYFLTTGCKLTLVTVLTWLDSWCDFVLVVNFLSLLFLFKTFIIVIKFFTKCLKFIIQRCFWGSLYMCLY